MESGNENSFPTKERISIYLYEVFFTAVLGSFIYQVYDASSDFILKGDWHLFKPGYREMSWCKLFMFVFMLCFYICDYVNTKIVLDKFKDYKLKIIWDILLTLLMGIAFHAVNIGDYQQPPAIIPISICFCFFMLYYMIQAPKRETEGIARRKAEEALKRKEAENNKTTFTPVEKNKDDKVYDRYFIMECVLLIVFALTFIPAYIHRFEKPDSVFYWECWAVCGAVIVSAIIYFFLIKRRMKDKA